MFAKISLTAAFLLMMTPPIALSSKHDASSLVSIAWPAHESSPASIVVAQQPPIGIYEKNQSDQGASENENENENGNDNETNENGDDNQNADGTETDQENTAAGDAQQPPSINPYQGGAQMVPQMNGFAQPVNPNQ